MNLDSKLAKEMARLFYSMGNLLNPSINNGRKQSVQFETDDLKALKSDWDAVGRELGRMIPHSTQEKELKRSRSLKIPYDAKIVAAYVVHRAFETKTPIYHRHIQQILFYLQAHWLIMYERSLFNEPIMKMKMGPTVPQVSHEYKGFGTWPISYIPKLFAISPPVNWGYTEFDVSMVNEYDREQMNPIVDNLLSYKYRDLIHLSISLPIWENHKDQILAGEQIPYTNEEISRYYSAYPNGMDICYRSPSVKN